MYNGHKDEEENLLGGKQGVIEQCTDMVEKEDEKEQGSVPKNLENSVRDEKQLRLKGEGVSERWKSNRRQIGSFSEASNFHSSHICLVPIFVIELKPTTQISAMHIFIS